MEKVMRKVLGPNGPTMKEFTIGKKPEVKEVIVDEATDVVETNETDESKPVVTAELINSMELNEMRVIASDNGIKLGNRGKVKAREFLIKELKLEDEVEL